MEIKEFVIVVKGNFNPTIVHPQWLCRKQLISKGVADSATVHVNHPEISEFELEFCSIQVLREQFIARTTRETHFRSIRDLTRGIFSELSESPINKLGINLHAFYKFLNTNDFRAFGHKIVPKAPLWNQVIENPGLINISIQSKEKENNQQNLYIRTSNRLKPYCLEISVNDLFSCSKGASHNPESIQFFFSILDDKWEKSLNKSQSIIEKVYKYGRNTKN